MNISHSLSAIRASAIELDHELVPDEARASGSPQTGHRALMNFGPLEVGVWEMTEGSMLDTEVDEVFIVLSGAATVVLLGDGADSTPLSLGPGSICRLEAGMRTRWDVTETLRKVYLVGSDQTSENNDD
jgi:uncharacterized cupin superfamily protein